MPQDTQIFDKIDIINIVTNTYSCSIKAIDTQYGNLIYSTGFHCVRFQHNLYPHAMLMKSKLILLSLTSTSDLFIALLNILWISQLSSPVKKPLLLMNI